MKKVVMIVLAVAQMAFASAQNAPADKRFDKMGLSAMQLAHYMAPGVNLGNTMEACDWNDIFTNHAGLKSETSWQSDKTTPDYISSLKKQGFNSLRIPCSWVAGHLIDKENMTIDPDWMHRIKEIVDYGLDAGLCVIINEHWDGGWMEHDAFTDKVNVAERKEMYRKLWVNIARAFKNYDERLLFAALNEPGVGGGSPQAVGDMLAPDGKEFADRLLEYEQVFIDAVRSTGGKNAKRVLIVQGPKTEIDITEKDTYDIARLKDKAKNRLMAEVHFYDPYTFTLMDKDADWGKVALYWKGHEPSDPAGRTVNTIWYGNENVDAYQHITNQVMKMKRKFVDKGYPVVIGEYGANRKDASVYGGDQEKHDESMMAWYSAVTAEMMKAGLLPYVWDINVQPLPHMTLFDRKHHAVSDSYIFKGVMDGAAEGMEGYHEIYPKP
ncbi:MAG TPA: hypothetical protein DDW28_01365 [Prevotella sp.]|nr:glycoside hydrolase family 5 protein [uncultured Prevotella sp.]HBF04802.1 hypothetical protein [Candidatus Segatella violae]